MSRQKKLVYGFLNGLIILAMVVGPFLSAFTVHAAPAGGLVPPSSTVNQPNQPQPPAFAVPDPLARFGDGVELDMLGYEHDARQVVNHLRPTIDLPHTGGVSVPVPETDYESLLINPHDLSAFADYGVDESSALEFGFSGFANSRVLSTYETQPLNLANQPSTPLFLPAQSPTEQSDSDAGAEDIADIDNSTMLYLPVIAGGIGEPPPEIPNQITITPSTGGTLITTDGILELFAPNGSVTTTTTIYYESLLGLPVPGGREVFGAHFDLSAETLAGYPITQFQEELTLTIQYPETAFNGQDESRGFIGYWDQEQSLWIPLVTTMDTEANIAIATTDHFTEFALLLLPECGDIDWDSIPASLQPAFLEACNRVGIGTLGEYLFDEDLGGIWAAHFVNGSLIYNSNLGMAYYVTTELYFQYPTNISLLGMPTNDTTIPPEVYRDAYHDFRSQPFNSFDYGFIGITGGVAEEHLNYPQILDVGVSSSDLGDGTVELTFFATVDPAPETSDPTARLQLDVEFEDRPPWSDYQEVPGGSYSFIYPEPIFITETVSFYWTLDRFYYDVSDDLVGYAPCLYYDYGQPYGPISVVSNFQTEVGCEGGGGGDFLPPNIQFIEVWPDGEGNLSITVEITDNSGVIASYDLTSTPDYVSVPLTPIGGNYYNAILSDIPINEIVNFTITATDPAGLSASVSGSSRSPFFGRNGLSCVCQGKDRAVGNPVTPATGNKVQQLEAMMVSGVGGADIEIVLMYNSQDGRMGIVGQGWRFPYQMDMRLVNNLLLNGAEINYGGGRKILFTDNGDGTYSPQTPDIHDQLFQSGSNFILKKKSLDEYEFDADGRLIAMRDPNGNAVQFIYTGDQLTRIENDAGRWVDISYNSAGFIETMTAPEGRQVSFSYDGDKLVSFTNGRGNTWQYEYEDRPLGTLLTIDGQPYEAYDYLLTGTVTPKGHYKNQQTYDERSRVQEQSVGENETRLFVYDDDANTVSITDVFSNTTVHHYDENRLLIMVTHANGTTGTFDYDDDANQDYVQDQEGREWYSVFDDEGNRTMLDGPLGWHEEWTYNALNRMTSHTIVIDSDGRSRTTFYEYDDFGNLIGIIDTLDYTSTIEYDDRGLPIRIVDFNNNVTINEYDPVTGDLLRTTNGAGDETEFGYDDLGRVITEVNGRDLTYTYIYDNNDNLTDVLGPNDYHISYLYDNNDNIAYEIDPLGGVISYTHNTSELVISIENQLGFTTLYTYDDMDKLVELQDAEGRIWTYEYDTVYNIIAIHAPEDTHTFYQYNGVNNVTHTTECNSALVGGSCPDSRTTFVEYDALDRIVRQTENYIEGLPSSADTNVLIQYQYDIVGTLRVLTDALDHTTLYEYSDRDELERMEDAEGQITRYEYDGNGLLTKLTNPRNFETSYTYDGANRLATVVDAAGSIYQYFYDGNGNLQEEIDSLDIVTRYEYDDLERVSHLIQNYVDGGATTNEQNVTTEFAYDNAGNLRFVFDPRGSYVTEHQYDSAFRRVLTIDAEDGETEYGYDQVNNLVSVVDANGHETTFEYDDLNRQREVTNPELHSVEFVYDRLSNLREFTDARGYSTTYEYDGMNRLVLTIDAMLGEWSYTYDAMGNVQCATDANGHDNDCYTYDDVYRVLTVTDAEGFVTEFVYDPNGNIEVVIDGNGNPTEYTFDVLDRVETMTNAEEETTAYAYDRMSNQTQLIEADGIITLYAYDPLYRLASVTQNWRDGEPESADVNVDTHYGYDEVGNLLSILDANEHETRFSYDGLNRMVEEVDADDFVWSYEYDPVGNRTVRIDANGNRTDYVYYDDDQLATITYELDGTVVFYLYDPNNNRTIMTDWLGTTTWNYDPLNRVTDVTDPFSRQLAYGYDPVSNRTSLTYADGRVVTYSYLDNNWLDEMQYPDENVTTYTRDGVGLTTAIVNSNDTRSDMVYDRANRLLSTTSVQTSGAQDVINSFSYTYNEVGHRTQMVAEYSWRNPSVVTSDYTYDGLRRLVRDEDSEGVWTDYVYDRVGNRLELHTNDDSQSPRPFDEQDLYYGYSDTNRLLTVVGDTHPGQPSTKRQDNVGQAIYAFRHEVLAQRGKHIEETAADNLLAMADDLIAELEDNPPPSVPDVTLAIEAIRTQVEADRLAGLIDSDGIANSLLVKLRLGDEANNGVSGELQTQTFDYDPNGNRINKEYPGPQGPRIQGTDYAYDPENRLIEALDYQMNVNGNRIDRAITTLEHDGNGRRLVKTYDPNEGGGGAKRVEYVFDGLDPVAEYNIWNPQYENFYRGDLNRIVMMHHFPSGTAGQMYWYHYDGLGSVSGLTKQNGQSHHNYRYHPYGSIEMPPGNFTDPHNHYTFTGQEWDENLGLYEFYARDYDSVNGVWLTQDSYRGLIEMPKSLHRYSYVRNNPTTYAELYGYMSEEDAQQLIKDNRKDINDAAEHYGVDAEVIAGIIYIEQTRNEEDGEDARDLKLAKWGFDSSLGDGQVKISTAKRLEKDDCNSGEEACVLPPTPHQDESLKTARIKALLEFESHINYVAAELKSIEDNWREACPNIDEMPIILATLYNLGPSRYYSGWYNLWNNPTWDDVKNDKHVHGNPWHGGADFFGARVNDTLPLMRTLLSD